MSRFLRQLSKLNRLFQPKNSLLLDLGSLNTQVFLNNKLKLKQETSLILDQQKIWPVKSGVIVDSGQALIFLNKILSNLSRQGEINFLKYKLFCLIPSGASQVEKLILENLLKNLNLGKWQLISKAEAASSSCLDIGSDLTEVILKTQNGLTQAKSIYCAGNAFSQLIIRLVRSKYNLEINLDTARKIQAELSETEYFNPDFKSAQKINIKGKSLNSSLPQVETIDYQIFQDSFNKLAQDLADEILIFLSDLDANLIADLEPKFDLSGLASQLAGLDLFLSNKLQAQLEPKKHVYQIN